MFSGLFAVTIIFVIFAVIASPALVSQAILRRIRAKIHKRSLANQIIAVSYEPPASLRPAELGYVVDQRYDGREMWVTILDLVERQLITIGPDTQLNVSSKEETTPLEPFERAVIDFYNLSKNPSAVYGSGVQTQIAATSFNVSNVLYQSLVTKALFIPKTRALIQEAVRVLASMVFAALCFVLLIASMSINTENGVYAPWSPQAFGVAIFAVGIFHLVAFPLVFGFHWLLLRMSMRKTGGYWRATKHLKTLWPDIEGYRQFVTTVDMSRIEHEIATGSLSANTQKIMPYVIALNLPVDWKRYVELRTGITV